MWCPPSFEQFVMVDDDGGLLNRGTGTGKGVPRLEERRRNYQEVEGSKYATEAVEARGEGEL